MMLDDDSVHFDLKQCFYKTLDSTAGRFRLKYSTKPFISTTANVFPTLFWHFGRVVGSTQITPCIDMWGPFWICWICEGRRDELRPHQPPGSVLPRIHPKSLQRCDDIQGLEAALFARTRAIKLSTKSSLSQQILFYSVVRLIQVDPSYLISLSILLTVHIYSIYVTSSLLPFTRLQTRIPTWQIVSAEWTYWESLLGFFLAG